MYWIFFVFIVIDQLKASPQKKHIQGHWAVANQPPQTLLRPKFWRNFGVIQAANELEITKAAQTSKKNTKFGMRTPSQ